MKQFTILFTLLALLLFNSCDKEELSCDKEELTQTITLEFNHVFDAQDFTVGEQAYELASGQEVVFTEFKYYISNIKFVAGDRVYAVPDSYHLIEVRPNDPSTYVLVLNEIPIGYNMEIELSIGIDAEANSNLDHNMGNLDPAKASNMPWTWNTGYKFLRVEGEFTDLGGNRRGLVMHPGEDANYKQLRFTRSTIIDGIDVEDKFYFRVNVSELFKNPNTIDLEEQNTFMFMPASAVIGENYANGFIELIN